MADPGSRDAVSARSDETRKPERQAHTAFERLPRIDTARLYLRPMQLADADLVVAWRSVPGTARMFLQRPPTREEHLAWFASPRWDRIDYVVVHRDSDEAIGVVNYKDLDLARGTAETGTLIGDPARRGQGFAHEVKVAWMLYGFAVLELDAVLVHIRADNTRMIEIDTRLGYETEARLTLDTVHEAGVPFVRMRLAATTALRHPAFLAEHDPHGFREQLARRLGGEPTGSRR